MALRTVTWCEVIGDGQFGGVAVAITTTGGCSGSGSGSASITMTSGTLACVVHYNQAGTGGYSAATEVTEQRRQLFDPLQPVRRSCGRRHCPRPRTSERP